METPVKKLYFTILLIFLLTIYVSSCNNNFRNISLLSDIDSENALLLARGKEGNDYLWGGNGPDLFDCSGLIIWSYQESINAQMIFYDGQQIVSDINMQTMYDFNIQKISNVNDVKPGYVIFITNEIGLITHGGLVVNINDEEVNFINASSYYNKVVTDTWGLNDIVRDQWIVGYGRMIRSY